MTRFASNSLAAVAAVFITMLAMQQAVFVPHVQAQAEVPAAAAPRLA